MAGVFCQSNLQRLVRRFTERDMKNIIGVLLVGLPFVAIFIFCVIEFSLAEAVGIFALTASLCISIKIGVDLLYSA